MNDLKELLDKANNRQDHGFVKYYYRGADKESMPADGADPIEYLGDRSLLKLSPEQEEEARLAIRRDLARRGREKVWRDRTFRKNVILSFGRIV